MRVARTKFRSILPNDAWSLCIHALGLLAMLIGHLLRVLAFLIAGFRSLRPWSPAVARDSGEIVKPARRGTSHKPRTQVSLLEPRFHSQYLVQTPQNRQLSHEIGDWTFY